MKTRKIEWFRDMLFPLFCRGLLFDHMAHDHGFNVGLPDNIGTLIFLTFSAHITKRFTHLY